MKLDELAVILDRGWPSSPWMFRELIPFLMKTPLAPTLWVPVLTITSSVVCTTVWSTCVSEQLSPVLVQFGLLAPPPGNA